MWGFFCLFHVKQNTMCKFKWWRSQSCFPVRRKLSPKVGSCRPLVLPRNKSLGCPWTLASVEGKGFPHPGALLKSTEHSQCRAPEPQGEGHVWKLHRELFSNSTKCSCFLGINWKYIFLGPTVSHPRFTKSPSRHRAWASMAFRVSWVIVICDQDCKLLF